MSNINLDGAETSVIKTLGFGGAPMRGSDLKSRLVGIGKDELFSILQCLVDCGYVSCNRDLEKVEDVDRTTFFVNPGYAKELREAIDPEPKETNKRVRRV